MGKYKKNITLIYLCLSCITLIIFACFVTWIIYTKDSSPQTSKSSLIFSDTTTHYYEPKENIDQKDYRDWLTYSPTYHYNGDTFNDRFDYSVVKEDGVFRIITIGDSNTEGKFINTGQNYPEQLEDLLNLQKCRDIKKFEVINLGVSGYDLQYSMERFKRRGLKYNPDLVLWYISGPSFHKIMEKIAPKILEYREQMKSSGELKQHEANGNYYPFETKAKNELFAQYPEEERIEYQRAVLKRFKQLYPGILILLTVGNIDPSQFPSEIAMNFDQKYKGILADFAQKNDNTYFYYDLPTLENPAERLIDLHPNAEGYRLFSNSIYEYLKTNQFISCN